MSSDPTRRWQHVNDTTNLTWVYTIWPFTLPFTSLYPTSDLKSYTLYSAYASHVILCIVVCSSRSHTMASTQTSQFQLKANLPSTDAPKTWYFASENAILESAPPLLLNVGSWSVESVGFISLGVLGVVKKKAEMLPHLAAPVKLWSLELNDWEVHWSSCYTVIVRSVQYRVSLIAMVSAHVQGLECSCSLLSTAKLGLFASV